MATSVDSVHKSSDVVNEYVCSACESKTFEESADYFCETCMKFFCGKCIYHHDQIYVNHSQYGRGETNKWPLTKKMEELLLRCDSHKGEKLKMFCHDHSQLCCSDCVLLHHRQCTNVALISESAKKLSCDMQQLSINLQTILDQFNMLKSTQEASIQFLEVSYNEKLQAIRDMRNKLNASLDELENTTLKELDKVRDILQTSLKNGVENCSRLKDELQELGEAVEGLGEKSKNEIEFIASRKCLEKIKESEAYLKENHVKVLPSMEFQVNVDIEEYLSKKSCLGRFVVLNPDQVLTVKRKSEYSVTILSDTLQTPSIKGICSLPCDYVIVVDTDNKKVKLFDQKYNVVSCRYVSGNIWDICQVTSWEVAVAVDKNVMFFSVKNGQLIEGMRFQLPHDAVGIAHHLGALYITSFTALYHYTLTGTLVKKLYEDTGRGFIVCRCAVNPAGDRIYVTNNDHHKLLTLTMDGTLLSTFTDPELQHPWGVHVTAAGHVLVCGQTSNAVIQVDREGRQKLATLLSQKDGVSYPQSVCSNTNRDQINVGQIGKIIVVELK